LISDGTKCPTIGRKEGNRYGKMRYLWRRSSKAALNITEEGKCDICGKNIG
jgi:hypothetical protein